MEPPKAPEPRKGTPSPRLPRKNSSGASARNSRIRRSSLWRRNSPGLRMRRGTPMRIRARARTRARLARDSPIRTTISPSTGKTPARQYGGRSFVTRTRAARPPSCSSTVRRGRSTPAPGRCRRATGSWRSPGRFSQPTPGSRPRSSICRGSPPNTDATSIPARPASPHRRRSATGPAPAIRIIRSDRRRTG